MEKFNSIYDVVKKVVVLAVIISLTITVIDLSYKNMDIKGVYITKYKIKNQVSNSKGDRCSLTESLFKRVKNKKDFFGYSEKFITENEIAKDIDCNLAVGLLSKDNLKIIP